MTDRSFSFAFPQDLVLALDGVGGTGIMPLSLMAATKLAGKNLRVKRFFWNHGIGRPFRDLLDREHINRKGTELAELIEEMQEADEFRTVQIVAKSGGCLVAVKAMELLPENVVTRVILLSPSISPSYDLSPAMKAAKEVNCFYSTFDRLILGLGTSIFGTSDGVRTVGAGCVGFINPPRRCKFPDQYKKLSQEKWEPHMLKQMHNGMHFGSSATPWLLHNVVPLLARVIL